MSLLGSEPEPKDPLEILSVIEKTVSDTMYVLKDYHTFMKDAQIVRKLRDIIAKPKSYSPIIIVSPIMNIPTELEKIICVVDYPLPDISEVTEMVIEAAQTINQDIDVEIVARSCLGLTTDEIEGILAKSWVISNTLDSNIILSEKKQIIQKSGILEYYDSEEDLNQVGGLDNLKLWLNQRSRAFESKAQEFGLPTPKGLLLLGIPGSGKSLVCKAMSRLWNVPLLKLDIGRVMSGVVGSSEENMRKVIKLAESIAPCILFIDELDKGLSGIASSNFSDGGTISRVAATLLHWGQEKTKPVFIVATANNVKELPPELLRKGRFDDIFFIDLPNRLEICEIVKIHLSKRGRNPSYFNVNTLAAEYEDRQFTGAEIEESIVSAMFDVYSASNGEQDITTRDIMAAIESTKPLASIMREKVEELRSWCSERARTASVGL
jgi:AAA+ superfamily predicted ATPase